MNMELLFGKMQVKYQEKHKSLILLETMEHSWNLREIPVCKSLSRKIHKEEDTEKIEKLKEIK